MEPWILCSTWIRMSGVSLWPQDQEHARTMIRNTQQVPLWTAGFEVASKSLDFLTCCCMTLNNPFTINICQCGWIKQFCLLLQRLWGMITASELLYLCRALKLTRRSRWDWVWTSLFFTECRWRPDSGSTSKSDRIEFRESGRHQEAITIKHDKAENTCVHLKWKPVSWTDDNKTHLLAANHESAV